LTVEKVRLLVLDQVLDLAELPPISVPGDLVRELLSGELRRDHSGRRDAGAAALLADEIGVTLRTLYRWLDKPPESFALDHPVIEQLPADRRLTALLQESKQRERLELELAPHVRYLAEIRDRLPARERPALEDALWLHQYADWADMDETGPEGDVSLLERLRLARSAFRDEHGREPRGLRSMTRKRAVARIRAERAYLARVIGEADRYEPFDASRVHDLTEAAVKTGFLSRGSRPRGYSPEIDWSAPEHNTWGRLSDPERQEGD
jgi:hypothetical protein